MAQARFHYMVDLFYPEAGRPDGLRKQSHRIVASSDSEAISEARNATILVPSPTPPSFCRVRKVFRTREETIFDSSKVPHA